MGRFVAWVLCPDCGGRGCVRRWLIFQRQCQRCGGDAIVAPPEPPVGAESEPTPEPPRGRA